MRETDDPELGKFLKEYPAMPGLVVKWMAAGLALGVFFSVIGIVAIVHSFAPDPDYYDDGSSQAGGGIGKIATLGVILVIFCAFRLFRAASLRRASYRLHEGGLVFRKPRSDVAVRWADITSMRRLGSSKAWARAFGMDYRCLIRCGKGKKGLKLVVDTMFSEARELGDQVQARYKALQLPRELTPNQAKRRAAFAAKQARRAGAGRL
jgi:hypothetical protein